MTKPQGVVSRTVHLPGTLFSKTLHSVLHVIYSIVQTIIIFLFAPPPPPKQWAEWDGTQGELGTEGGIEKGGWNEHWGGIKPHGRIAVVGAGLTGVSSAACVSLRPCLMSLS